MSCACSKKTEPKVTYVVTANGVQKSYKSEVEAKAAALRTGGTVRTVS